MLRKIILNLSLFLLLSSFFSITLSACNDPISSNVEFNTFSPRIVKYYSSWADFKSMGENIEENSIIYTLSSAISVQNESKYIMATYSVPTSFSITYDSWAECQKAGTTITSNNLDYYLNKAERLNNSDKFIATYSLNYTIDYRYN